MSWIDVSVTRWLGYFSHLAIYLNENLLKGVTKFCQKVNNPHPQKLPKTLKILPKWLNFAKSDHTDCRNEVAENNFCVGPRW